MKPAIFEPKSIASNTLRMNFYTFRALPLDLQSNALEPAKQCLRARKAMLYTLQTNAPQETKQWVIEHKAMLRME